MVYYKYKQRGFSTPTKKVELYSTILEKWGYDPFPNMLKFPRARFPRPFPQNYPYILNARAVDPNLLPFGEQTDTSAEEIRPDPIVEILRDRKKHNIQDGRWVYISSPRGCIKQRAKIKP